MKRGGDRDPEGPRGRGQLGPALLTAGLVFAAYALTMARGPTFWDSPELALVAHELGVGHPIGQPLHTLLGFVFAHLPGLTPHVGLTLMSALLGAVCVLPTWTIVDRLAGPAKTRLETMARAVALVGVGLSPIAWEPSTRVEVYSLAALGALFTLAGATRARRRGWLLVGLGLGLTASAHAVIAFGAGLAILPLALARAWPDSPSRPREGAGGRDRAPADPSTPDTQSSHRQRALLAALGSLAHLALGALLGLLPYAYVPLASRDPHTFAWGGATDLASFTAYLSGADYAHNQTIDRTGWLEHLVALAAWSAANATLPLALVGLTGFVWLGGRCRGLRWALPLLATVTVGFVAANVVFHPEVPDYRGYFLAPLWLAGAGLAALALRALRSGGRGRVYGAAIALLPALALLASPSHLFRIRDDPSLAAVLARGALDEAPPDAIVVVEADHWVAPLLYVQQVERRRPDVAIVPHGLSSSSWYWEHLFARHPSLDRMPLVGPGGRDARIARLAAANPSRPVLTESWSLAARLDRRPCGVGWLVFTEDSCASAPPRPAEATAAIERAAPYHDDALEVAAWVGETRGEALWRLGAGAPALEAFVAGLERSGVAPTAPSSPARHAPPLRGPLPSWSRDRPLHDPARNIVLAGLLLHAMGRAADALRYVDAALALGLEQAASARSLVTR